MFDGCSIFAKYQLPLGDDPPMEWLCRPVIVLNVGGVFLILPQLPEGHQLKKGEMPQGFCTQTIVWLRFRPISSVLKIYLFSTQPSTFLCLNPTVKIVRLLLTY